MVNRLERQAGEEPSLRLPQEVQEAEEVVEDVAQRCPA
jgi:hypothetical protein